jgi:tripartite-type tricarboxylate transporter receptor subunit TctC
MKNRKREICTSGSVRDEDGQPPHLLGRRKFHYLAAGAVALPAVSRIARAQTYPTRPVRIIVGFTAGNNIDIVAQLIGQWLSERLGQPFIIDNRPGASGNIAAEAVVRAPADGHTLLMTGTFNPAKTVPEFIAYAKANPRNIMMASAGPGSALGLYGELFKSMAGVDLAAVNYRGSPAALSDLIAGHVHVMFDPIASSVGYIKAGQLRALGVTTAKRIEVLPDVPTIGEFVPGYEASGWQGSARRRTRRRRSSPSSIRR